MPSPQRGGAAHELNELTWGRGTFAAALELINATARADVIAGTSAGGINGAALALGQSNVHADLADLRELWAEDGRMEALLRRPFAGQPTSLLRGDYFLERLRSAMRGLVGDRYSHGGEQRPIDLTLTTTLLTGAQDVTIDEFQTPLPDVRYDGRFHFRTADFTEHTVDTTATALATAARATASFPVAFDPVFIDVPVVKEVPVADCPPCSHGGHSAAAAVTAPTPQPTAMAPPHPVMTRYADWARDPQLPEENRSRFVVDGGLLANTPTRQALAGIERMGAETFVRRVMLLIYPQAPLPGAEEAADPEKPPTLVEALRGVAAAVTSLGNRTFTEDVDKHNIAAASWRDGRTAVLRQAAEGHLDILLGGWWPLYRDQRIRQEAADWIARLPGPVCRSTTWAREQAEPPSGVGAAARRQPALSACEVQRPRLRLAVGAPSWRSPSPTRCSTFSSALCG